MCQNVITNRLQVLAHDVAGRHTITTANIPILASIIGLATMVGLYYGAKWGFGDDAPATTLRG